jgi:uncharacterized protein YdiU (UPF0061 family)
VLTRTAPSFIRFGHFEHFSYLGQQAQLKTLADYVIENFYAACLDSANPYAALLEAVSERTARLLAQWQAVGFCHGVMNTDNMSILGLTIDYGPFQFLDAFDPAHVCNHSDSQGRYAYNQQPNIAYWNLFCLGQALLPLIGEQQAALAALEPYKSLFPAALQDQYRAKLGLLDARAEDKTLIDGILQLLAQDRVDYSIFWRRLCGVQTAAGIEPVRDLFVDRAAFDTWGTAYRQRIQGQDEGQRRALMIQHNPKYILRNHLGEQAIQKARQKDFSLVQELLTILETPFDEHPQYEAYAGFAPDWASQIEISCSS